MDPPTTPDRGRQAWLVVWGGFLNFTASFGMMNSFGVFLSHYETRVFFPENPFAAPWIGSVQLFLMFTGGIVIGPAFDTWGARRLMIPGAIACIASHIGASFSSKFYQLLLTQGFLFGIRNAMLYHPTVSSISEWFDKNRALALGIAVSGSSAGGILWPPVMAKLIDSVGFAWTNRLIAIMSSPLLLLACYLVEGRGSSRDPDAHDQRLQSPAKNSFRQITDKHFLTLSMALLFVFMGMLVPFYWIPLYAVSNGVDGAKPPILLAICYSGSFLGRILTGWAADRLGRFNVLAASAAVTGILIFMCVIMKSFASLIVFSVLFGFSSGGLIPLGAACVAQMTPNLGRIGTRIGVMMAICSTGALAGGPASRVILGSGERWELVFYFAGGTVFVGVLLLLLERYLWTTHRAGFVQETA